MKLTEQQIKEIEEAKRQFLWKVEIFEYGFNYKREEKCNLIKKIQPTVTYSFDTKEEDIFYKKIEDLDEKEFAYQLGKYIQSISNGIVSCFEEVIFPLDALLEEYEDQIKKILL